jgi:hypothetical protein
MKQVYETSLLSVCMSPFKLLNEPRHLVWMLCHQGWPKRLTFILLQLAVRTWWIMELRDGERGVTLVPCNVGSLKWCGRRNWTVKRPGREVNHSPLPSTEVNEWGHTSIPLYAFMPCTGTLPFTFKGVWQWGVTPCRLGRPVPMFRRNVKQQWQPGLFSSEDEGIMFLRNVGNHWPNDTASYPIRLESSGTTL